MEEILSRDVNGFVDSPFFDVKQFIPSIWYEWLKHDLNITQSENEYLYNKSDSNSVKYIRDNKNIAKSIRK